MRGARVRMGQEEESETKKERWSPRTFERGGWILQEEDSEEGAGRRAAGGYGVLVSDSTCFLY